LASKTTYYVTTHTRDKLKFFLLYHKTLPWISKTTSSYHSSVEVFGSVCTAMVTPLLLNSLKTPAKVYSTESGTTNIMSGNSSFLTSIVTTPPRRHNFILATKTDHRNVITRELFTSIY